MKYYLTKAQIGNYVELCDFLDGLGIRSDIYVDGKTGRMTMVYFKTSADVILDRNGLIDDHTMTIDLLWLQYFGQREHYVTNCYLDLTEDEVMLLKLSLP